MVPPVYAALVGLPSSTFHLRIGRMPLDGAEIEWTVAATPKSTARLCSSRQEKFATGIVALVSLDDSAQVADGR